MRISWRGTLSFSVFICLVLTFHPTQVQTAKLSPEVAELIRGTSFEHSSALPDPNESAEVMKAWLAGVERRDNGVDVFTLLVQKYPESRYAHFGLANAFHLKFEDTKEVRCGKAALREMILASQIGASFGRFHYVEWMSRLAVQTGETELVSAWFEQILQIQPHQWEVNLEYGKLLEQLNDSRAELYYSMAMKVRPLGNWQAQAEYAEYMIKQGRFEEVLKHTIVPGEQAYWLDFLHGYALEKLGRGQEAVRKYRIYAKMTNNRRIPSLYRIENSPFQTGLIFCTAQDPSLECVED